MKDDFPKKLYFLVYDDEDKDMYGGPWMAKPTRIMKKVRVRYWLLLFMTVQII